MQYDFLGEFRANGYMIFFSQNFLFIFVSEDNGVWQTKKINDVVNWDSNVKLEW